MGTRIVGSGNDTISHGYGDKALLPLTKAFLTTAKDILNEQQIDLFMNGLTALQLPNTRQTLKDLFMNECADPNEYDGEEYDEVVNEYGALFDNDCKALLEYAPMTQFNPVIGMTFPLHKNILMNNIFDKGAIPKFVATSPRFTISMERRLLVDAAGNEIDMYLHQNRMYDAMESTAPLKDTILMLPEVGNTDILATTFGIINSQDANLSTETHISALLVKSYVLAGEKYWDVDAKEEKTAEEDGDKFVWVKVKPASFVPGFGELDRIIMSEIHYTYKELEDGAAAPTEKAGKVIVSGNNVKNKFNIMTNLPATVVAGCKLTCRLDTSSAMLRTCSVRWKTITDFVDIPNAIPLNTPISPEEVKDIGALYQVNQLNKIMSMLKLVLANYKDDKIHKALDDSFNTMPMANKLAKTFDWAPREGYYADHIKWRRDTFMDALDTIGTYMYQVLNDPNMTITVIGNPDIIRKISPTEYTYQTPSNIGPVALEFKKTVTTTDSRVYNFISSDKMRDNKNLIILLCPRNSERIVYRIYDYQLYVSNEIRNWANPSLPAIHAFERFKFVEYQPVQARLKILNTMGLRDYVENDDPIGVSRMNDYTMNYPEGYSKIPKFIPDKEDHVNPNTIAPGFKHPPVDNPIE